MVMLDHSFHGRSALWQSAWSMYLLDHRIERFVAVRIDWGTTWRIDWTLWKTFATLWMRFRSEDWQITEIEIETFGAKVETC